MRRFLEHNPTGPYHDRAVALLDDLAWREAQRKGDTASLKGYLGTYPSGRHKEEAATQLARLTPPPAATPAPQATGACANSSSSSGYTKAFRQHRGCKCHSCRSGWL